MRLDLLWWQHQRPPRPHVAEPGAFNYTQVFDMSTMLDPDTSSFTTLLSQMGGGRWVSRDVPTEVGAIFQDAEGKWQRAYKVKHVRPTDWFENDHWDVLVTEPTLLTTSHGKIEWLEDELFPRVGTISESDNPVFRKGDIVTIIGGGK